MKSKAFALLFPEEKGLTPVVWGLLGLIPLVGFYTFLTSTSR